MRREEIVFLFDIDNTLLDNDRVTADLRARLTEDVGRRRAQAYWRHFEGLRRSLGFADYLGALQRFREDCPRDMGLLGVSRFMVDYPFASRVLPGALKAIEHARRWGPAAILSDGDVVFQPRKAHRSGLEAAVDGRVLIYVHKERHLADVEKRLPARRYVMLDDKIRILAAMKKKWGARVTTVFVRQGHYALDKKLVARYPAADVTIEKIGDFVKLDPGAFGG